MIGVVIFNCLLIFIGLACLARLVYLAHLYHKCCKLESELIKVRLEIEKITGSWESE